MCEQTGNLLLDFEKSIFDNVLDFSVDILEIPIDEFIDNEALKQVPVIGTIIGLGKATVAVRDMHLMKKLITFIAKINDGKMTRKKLNKYKEKLEQNKEKLNQDQNENI